MKNWNEKLVKNITKMKLATVNKCIDIHTYVYIQTGVNNESARIIKITLTHTYLRHGESMNITYIGYKNYKRQCSD